ncbi:hypothetical protein CVT26_011966 [Gymnopilus dilepis]|uniref:Heterokaryon incompatibility domain-containing protein n=1 Tax=Gymnopilus dilepis TaxID=231916 RepID=A0A409VYK7_9AGAR|nr:hypothetical protein CVT26_011966 [Gymnopilus dilepis]
MVLRNELLDAESDSDASDSEIEDQGPSDPFQSYNGHGNYKVNRNVASDRSEVDGITVPTLLPIPPSLQNSSESLCSTCKSLDLTPQRFVVLPGDPVVPGEVNDSDAEPPANITLGFIDDIRKKAPHCPFCRLVLAALGPKVPSVGNQGDKVEVTLTWRTDSTVRTLRPRVQTKSGDYYLSLQPNSNPEIAMLANDAPHEAAKKSQLVRLINDQIDFDMVRNWLSICRAYHGGACDESKLMGGYRIKDPAIEIPHFRLIDVVDNCIIPAPPGSRYVALSYIWGKIDLTKILRTVKDNYKQLEVPGSLSLPENQDRIPLTIRDAMIVARKLDIRYLWVDSLCIIQDDIGPGGSKMSSISMMDLVYGAAYLTIWAANGIDANAGLPGVRPNTRGIQQSIEQVTPNLRLAAKMDSQDFTRAEAYFTRAWT